MDKEGSFYFYLLFDGLLFGGDADYFVDSGSSGIIYNYPIRRQLRLRCVRQVARRRFESFDRFQCKGKGDRKATAANSQYMIDSGARMVPVELGKSLIRTSSEGPLATSVPLLQPLMTLAPVSHWRNDITPKRKSPAVPLSPCRMTSESCEIVWSRRRRPVASASSSSPMSTRSTTNNYAEHTSHLHGRSLHRNYDDDEEEDEDDNVGDGGDMFRRLHSCTDVVLETKVSVEASRGQNNKVLVSRKKVLVLVLLLEKISVLVLRKTLFTSLASRQLVLKDFRCRFESQ